MYLHDINLKISLRKNNITHQKVSQGWTSPKWKFLFLTNWQFEISHLKSHSRINPVSDKYKQVLQFLSFCMKVMSTLNTPIFDVSIRMVSWLRVTNLSPSQKYSCLCSCMKTDMQPQNEFLIWFFLKKSQCILSRQIKENQISQKTTGTAYSKKVNPRLVPQPDSHSLHVLWAHYAAFGYPHFISNILTCFNYYSAAHENLNL